MKKVGFEYCDNARKWHENGSAVRVMNGVTGNARVFRHSPVTPLFVREFNQMHGSLSACRVFPLLHLFNKCFHHFDSRIARASGRSQPTGKSKAELEAENADLREENEDPQKQLDTIADIVAPPDQDEDDDLDDGEAADEDGDDDQD